MLLDIQKNELIFSNMTNSKEIAQALQGVKGIKFRKAQNRFYVPLAYFEGTRRALRDYASLLSVSVRYEMFAMRFVKDAGPIVIDWHPDMCTIKGGPIPFAEIIPATSYFTKDAMRSKLYERQLWDGTVQLFNTEKGEFPSGLLERILNILDAVGTPYHVNRKFDYPKPKFTLTPVFTFEPTKDQIDAVHALEVANNGIAKLPTGFGKTSYVAAALIAKKGVRSMFLANQRVLINDAKSDFEEVFAGDKVHVGTIGDGEYDPADITVASIQGVVSALNPPAQLEFSQAGGELQVAKFRVEQNPNDKDMAKALKKAEAKVTRLLEKRIRSEQMLTFLKTVELFIVDESQVLGTDMWNVFLRACPAPYRYTLSATDTRADGGRVQIVAATGERRYESSASEQIEKGRLSEFQGFFQRFDHGLDRDVIENMQLDFHQAYRIFIVENEKRNSFLCDWLIKWAHEGFSVLGLVTRKAHAENVQDMLVGKGMKSAFFRYVDGDTPKKERKETIEDFRAGKFPILIGTSIFDVGFNAKNASKIVRFNAGASEVRETQRAGRTVRKREDNSRGESIDVLDLNVPFFQSQSFKRMKLLKDEFGTERVTVLKGTIDAPFDVVRLQEVVNEMPDETDRELGEKVIEEILNRRELKEVEVEIDLTEIEQDRDLMSMLDELTIKDGEY